MDLRPRLASLSFQCRELCTLVIWGIIAKKDPYSPPGQPCSLDELSVKLGLTKAPPPCVSCGNMTPGGNDHCIELESGPFSQTQQSRRCDGSMIGHRSDDESHAVILMDLKAVKMHIIIECMASSGMFHRSHGFRGLRVNFLVYVCVCVCARLYVCIHICERA